LKVTVELYPTKQREWVKNELKEVTVFSVSKCGYGDMDGELVMR
jgi:hypothetical protein